MKVRFVQQRLRLRLDDLELAALGAGQTIETSLSWAGGGWSVCLDPKQADIEAAGTRLTIGVAEQLGPLSAADEGIDLRFEGIKISIQKDFLPEHQ